jgi:calcineurin-like phosphoesterase family protein
VEKEAMTRIHFTADTHFGHHKLAEVRGFNDSIEMTVSMVDAWNIRVDPDDWVYIIGDFSFLNNELTIQILRRLHGRKILVPGNHDRNLNLAAKAEFYSVHAPLCDLKLNMPGQEHIAPADREKVRVTLCHFPMLVWNHMQTGGIHLHGHSHGHLRHPAPGGRMMDVGIDTPLGKANGFAPISFEQVMQEMKTRRFVGFDQHTEKTAEPA